MSTTDNQNPTQDGAGKFPLLQRGSKFILLKVLEGDRRNTQFKLHKDRIVIGSVISADVRLATEGVSPIHAVLEIIDGVATLYDLASDTGVFVNGARTVTQKLKAGDAIRIGGVVMSFGLEESSQVTTGERFKETGAGRKLFMNPDEDFKSLLLQDERDIEVIFDYRPSQKPALEIVMSWRGTILDVEHFVFFKQVTVGEGRKCDFGIPTGLATRVFPLVTRTAGAHTLNLDPKMRGVIQRKGQLQTLAQVRGNTANTFPMPLDEGDFAKISVGEVDFYLSFTAAPPRLKRKRILERDPFFFKILAGSLGFTAAIILALTRFAVPKPIEAEQLPERLATILYQPEKYAYKPKVPQASIPVMKTSEPIQKVEPPKPKKPEVTKLDIKPDPKNIKRPVPKEMDTKKPTVIAKAASGSGGRKSPGQNEAKEGQGARAKGKEGTRGTKNAKNSGTPQNLATRPSPEGGKGRGGGNSQVEDQGNVDFLKGASNKIQDLLGSTANRLGKGGDKLQGFGAFNTVGRGGLALSGDGKGGGGTAEGLGGLSDKGRGGGRVGTGKGAAGSGNGIIGGKARVVIRSGGPEEAVVMGAIDAGAVEAALLAHRDEFRYCYEKEVNSQKLKDPNPAKLAGRVGTNFVIGSSGRVTNAAVDTSTLGNREVESCILRVIKIIDFPVPRGGGIVQVAYPFKFSATGG